MNIGIFGGTFNPPHNGHLVVAEAVRTTLGLNKILFTPSYISPHKQEGEEILAHHRLEMTKIAIAGNKYFEILDYEIQKRGTSFTIDTIQYLLEKIPSEKLFVIVGMDNYLSFHEWKEPQHILELATLVVMNRPNFRREINEIIGTYNVQFVDVPNVDIASFDIRGKILRKESTQDLIHPEVARYISEHSLYL